jgi:hypothetical protein
VIELDDEDRPQLEALVRKGKAEQRMVSRARIVLAAGDEYHPGPTASAEGAIQL